MSRIFSKNTFLYIYPSTKMYTEVLILCVTFTVSVCAFRHKTAKALKKLQKKKLLLLSKDLPPEKKEIRFQERLYNVTHWLDKHPGGKVMEYYVNNGEDGTQAIQQFHHRSLPRVLKLLQAFPSRPLHPERDPGLVNNNEEVNSKYREMSQDFEKLYQDLVSEGELDPSIGHALGRMVELVIMAGISLALLLPSEAGLGMKGVGTLTLSLFHMRAAYLMHEAGHHSLTGTPGWDRFLQAVIFSLGSGQSSSWYRYHHSRHHSMPQRLHFDNDIDLAPLAAVSVKSVERSEKGLSFFLRHQAFLAIPVGSTIGGLSWRFCLHPLYVISRKLYLELFLMIIHYWVAFHLGVIPYMTSVAISMSIIMLNVSLNHTHLPVTEDPRHWVEYALVHTMNLDPSWWCDWWTGFLNYQIEHHLFPTMPGFRQRHIAPRVKELAKKHGLTYICEPYYVAVWKVLQNLQTVSSVLKDFSKA